jgi:hypothetical protein
MFQRHTTAHTQRKRTVYAKQIKLDRHVFELQPDSKTPVVTNVPNQRPSAVQPAADPADLYSSYYAHRTLYSSNMQAPCEQVAMADASDTTPCAGDSWSHVHTV